MEKIGVALLSGLIGALISAFLSYQVRLIAKQKEDDEERTRLALVNFLLLTDFIATDFYIKDLLGKLLILEKHKSDSYEASHSFAVFIASKLAEIKLDDLNEIYMVLKPWISAWINSMNKFEIDQKTLGRMGDVTIYSYHQLCSASTQLQVGFEFFSLLVDKGDQKLIDADCLHKIFLTYRAYANSVGLLRAALAKSAAVSDAYSYESLIRSFNAVKFKVAISLEHDKKLAFAKKAANETSSMSIPVVS